MNNFIKPKSINSSIDINEVINNISPYLNKEYIIDNSPDVGVPFDNVHKYFDKWIYNEFNELNMIKSLISFLNNLNVVNSDILNYIEQKLNIIDVYSVDVYNSINYGDFLKLVCIQYEKPCNNDAYYMFIILDNKIIINDTINESYNQLNEGGLAKHMNHPYEVNEFTFNDLKKIIIKLLDGKFNNVTEKMDGLNIFVSYDKNGNILAARNNKQISDPLTLNTIKEYFKSSIIGNTYYNALLTIDDEFKQKFNNLNLNKIFNNGKRWINTEIISTDTKNVIPYKNNLIVFHNIKTYKGDNEFENYDNELLYKLVKLLNNNSNFKIITSPILNINKSNNTNFKNNIINDLDKIKDKYNLTDKSTILDFKHNMLLDIILNDNILYKLTDSTIKNLINRWIYGPDKNNNIINILKNEKISDNDKSYIRNFDKNINNVIKNKMKPFDDIFIKVGNEVIQNISNIFNNQDKDKVIKYLNNKLSNVSDEISKSNDEDTLNKFYYELNRLSNVSNKLNATEGIVLSYKGHDLKITGSFAPLNKILGMEHGRFER